MKRADRPIISPEAKLFLPNRKTRGGPLAATIMMASGGLEAKSTASAEPPVYLDNNSTTMMPPEVVDAMLRWINRGNPSAEYSSAREAQKLLQRFRTLLAADGGFRMEGPRGYSIIFTSGGSEGNCHVANAAARAYAARTGKLPHIIISAMEHTSLSTCCLQLARDKMAQLTVIPVQKCPAGGRAREGGATGTVDPSELQKAIRPNTCLISVIAANGATGAINDLRALGAIARASRIPFHSDAVQFFGKSTFQPEALNLDAFSASFHTLHGPPGVGFLALRNAFVESYCLGALVCGTQNAGLRGGTANLPGVAGAFTAYKLSSADRGSKNFRIRRLRDGIQAALARRFFAIHVDDYCEARPRAPDGNPMTPNSSRAPIAPKTERGASVARSLDLSAEKGIPVIVWIGPRDRAKILPNTLFFAVLCSGGREFCNKKARALLEKKGIIVGAGAPPLLEKALDVPPELWRGVLQVSLSDATTTDDVAAFVEAFATIAMSARAREG
ncbi:cysteine desulfurase [Elysia marginata]|uniref:Cysteine desulfurase n=1 Tax=Elysia marginata TaxID=1093978 RepID=A0AAV4H027_9GAST|nr:cysteine desulfurase [Elysia marginata]